jgi:hypothetical protein
MGFNSAFKGLTNVGAVLNFKASISKSSRSFLLLKRFYQILVSVSYLAVCDVVWDSV